MRHLLSGNKARIAQAVAYIHAAGRTDEFAEKLLVIRRRRAQFVRRFFRVPLFRLAYSERERRSALSALGALWGHFGREIALALDFRASHFERGNAHNALIRRRDQRAIQPLVSALIDGHALEDWRCISTLGALGDLRAAEPLVQYMGLGTPASDSDNLPGARPWALDAGVEVGRALRLLKACDARAALAAALNSQVAHQRAAAALALAGWGDAQDVNAIQTLLGDPEPVVREAAVTALGELREPAAIDALKEALSDPDARTAAAAERALQQIVTTPSRRAIQADYAGLPRHARGDKVEAQTREPFRVSEKNT
jgi:HEAT repeat protein